MKRKILSVMAVCLCLSIMISGCSKKEEPSYPASNIVEPSMRNSSAGENASSPNKLSSKAVTPPASDFEYELSDDMEGVVIKKYKGTETAIKIPAEIEDIPVIELSNYGFWKTNHTYIEIPNSVKKIGDYCFSDCSSLETVIIPDSVTEIGGMAFSYCTSLESISIPKSVVKMGSSIFNKSGLRSIVIPNSITGDFGEQFTLPTGMFSSCENLTSIQLPNDLKIIPVNFVTDCESLSNITIPNTVTEIGFGAFSGCKLLTQIDFPASLETLAASALKDTGLKSLYIPDSVTLKGDFRSNDEYTYGFEEIRLPDNMKDMREMDFSGCRASLVKINLPASLEVLGGAEAAFLRCKNLKELVIPDELEKVEFGDLSFVGCSSLSLATQKRLKQLGYKGTF